MARQDGLVLLRQTSWGASHSGGEAMGRLALMPGIRNLPFGCHFMHYLPEFLYLLLISNFLFYNSCSLLKIPLDFSSLFLQYLHSGMLILLCTMQWHRSLQWRGSVILFYLIIQCFLFFSRKYRDTNKWGVQKYGGRKWEP